MEGVLGKYSLMKGDACPDATPFTSHSVDIAQELARQLHSVGFKSDGTEVMISGTTGKPLVAQIYQCPVYYQRLKHLVKDKIHCLDMYHEVLTVTGWKNITDITLDDKVATLVGNDLRYENPTNIFQYPEYEGTMMCICTSDIDMCVTAYHRMWVRSNEEGSENGYHFEYAMDLVGKDVWYKNLGGEYLVKWNTVYIKRLNSKYGGGVYCIEVPSGIFYTRRNGKCVWTGNSRSFGPINQLSHQPIAGEILPESKRTTIFIIVVVFIRRNNAKM